MLNMLYTIIFFAQLFATDPRKYIITYVTNDISRR